MSMLRHIWYIGSSGTLDCNANPDSLYRQPLPLLLAYLFLYSKGTHQIAVIVTGQQLSSTLHHSIIQCFAHDYFIRQLLEVGGKPLFPRAPAPLPLPYPWHQFDIEFLPLKICAHPCKWMSLEQLHRDLLWPDSTCLAMSTRQSIRHGFGRRGPNPLRQLPSRHASSM